MTPSAAAGREIVALAEWEARTGRRLHASTEAARWIAEHGDGYDVIVHVQRSRAARGLPPCELQGPHMIVARGLW